MKHYKTSTSNRNQRVLPSKDIFSVKIRDKNFNGFYIEQFLDKIYDLQKRAQEILDKIAHHLG